MQTLAVVLLSFVAMLTFLGQSLAYPYGPPSTACVDMFPSGHNTDAQTTTPPFELRVSSSTIYSGQNITLTLLVKSAQPSTSFKGMFVQARLAGNCNNTTPFGTFSIPATDNFLQTLSFCGQPNSAVSHKTNISVLYNKTFTWTAPSAIPGRMFFRATVVMDKTTFWTDVFSPYVTTSGDASAVPAKYCDVRKTLTQTSTAASTTTRAMSTTTRASSMSSSKATSTITTRKTMTTVRGTSGQTPLAAVWALTTVVAAVAAMF